MAEETMYAWTPILAGGESQEVRMPNGATRTVISKRNRIAVGSKVSKDDLTAESADPDRDWEAYIESGAIRPYEFPADLDPNSTESPINFLRRSLREAAEAEVSEEQQLLMAVGRGAVVSDEDLVAAQPSNVKEATAAANKTEPAKAPAK